MIWFILYVVGMIPAGIAGYNAWEPYDGFPRWFLVLMTVIFYPALIIWRQTHKALTETI